MSDLAKQSDNNEIDLIELIKVLWDKKIWIILSTLIFTTMAGMYAFTAKEKWTSTAEIIEPKITDLGSYLAIRKEYARILGHEFEIHNLSKHLFQSFIKHAHSLHERENFVTTSPLYSPIFEGKTEEQKRILVGNLIKNIIITKPDSKKNPDVIGIRISLSAENATLAQNSLAQFFNFINNAVFKEELENFLVIFNEKVKDLKFEIALIEQNLQIQKIVQVENLNKAYETAEKAGVKEYSKILGNTDMAIQSIAMSDTKIALSGSKLSDDTYLFMLGEKYLKAQMDIELEKDIIYPPRYYQIQEQLKNLEPLFEKFKTAKAESFSFLSSPDQPNKRDWPKRFILLLIGAVVGGVIGCIWVLGKLLFGHKNA